MDIANVLAGVEGLSGVDGLTGMADGELASAKRLMDGCKPNLVHTAASVMAKGTVDSDNGPSSMEKGPVAPRLWPKKLLNLFKEASVYTAQHRLARLPFNIPAATAASGPSSPTGRDGGRRPPGDLTVRSLTLRT